MTCRYYLFGVGRSSKSEAWQIAGWPMRMYCGPMLSLALHLELGLVYTLSIASARVGFRESACLLQMRC